MTTYSNVLLGLVSQPATITAEVTKGLPCLDFVGLPEAAQREARTRVRAALENSGYPVPLRRVTATIAPAELVKGHATQLDLALAIEILVAMGEVQRDNLAGWLLVSELSLTGKLRSIRGAVLHAQAARDRGFLGIIVAEENAAEAAQITGIQVRSAETLREVVDFLQGSGSLPVHGAEAFEPCPSVGVELQEIRGHAYAKRALEIAVAGGHHVLFTGPPGAGRTLLSRAVTMLAPPFTHAEALELTGIHSVAGTLGTRVPLHTRRPYRAPHHTTSAVGLTGGGNPSRPGELALAHRGVLSLDDLPEFPRETLEALRDPLEKRTVTVFGRERATYPARFCLIAGRNPCPCGYYGDPSGRCTCAADRVQRYQHRTPGFMQDKIALSLWLDPLPIDTITGPVTGPSSAEVRERVIAARAFRKAHGGFVDDAHLAAIEWDRAAQLQLSTIDNRYPVTTLRHILRVARTIADLDASESIRAHHLAEAATYQYGREIPT